MVTIGDRAMTGHEYGPHDPEGNPKTVEVYPRERFSEPIEVPIPDLILRQRKRINYLAHKAANTKENR